MTASNVVIPWHVSNDEHVRALLGNAAESNTDPVTQDTICCSATKQGLHGWFMAD